MKKGYTHISIVIDRSGSMDHIKADAEGGLNSFVSSQKNLEGSATFTLVEFDDNYNVVYNFADINTVGTYVLWPRGCTALLDSIGKQINELGTKLDSLSEEEKPEKVIFIIITDGFENASKEFNRARIKEMITHQEATYNWEFVFMAANQDAVTAGASLGVSYDKSMTFAATGDGTQTAFGSLSSNASAFRSGSDSTYNFKVGDRTAQANLGA